MGGGGTRTQEVVPDDPGMRVRAAEKGAAHPSGKPNYHYVKEPFLRVAAYDASTSDAGRGDRPAVLWMRTARIYTRVFGIVKNNKVVRWGSCSRPACAPREYRELCRRYLLVAACWGWGGGLFRRGIRFPLEHRRFV